MWVASGKDDVGLVGDRGLQQASKKQTKKNPHTLGRYKNNLKLCIDPALVIVHIFHSPKGPIHVSLKCKGKEKRNKKKKNNDNGRQRQATHPVGGNVPYLEVY